MRHKSVAMAAKMTYQRHGGIIISWPSTHGVKSENGGAAGMKRCGIASWRSGAAAWRHK